MKVIAEEDGEKGSAGRNPVIQCQEKALFLLKFAGLTKVHIKWDVSEWRPFTFENNLEIKDEFSKYLISEMISNIL